MKILSKYYDCIDYLNDYQSDNVFVRNQSVYYVIGIESTNKFKDRIYQYNDITNINYTLINKLYYFQDNPQLDCLEIYGKFIFLPNNKLDIPVILKVYNNDNDVHFKIEYYDLSDKLEINKELNKFINQQLIQNLTIDTDNKVRNQPCWYLIFDNVVRNVNNRHKSTYYWNILDTYNIWINFPLYRIEHLLNIKKELIYQDIELYLWNENKNNIVKEISNKDKIIQHGYDLKTSFRKDKQ